MAASIVGMFVLLLLLLVGVGGAVRLCSGNNNNNNNNNVGSGSGSGAAGNFVRRKESHFLVNGSPFLFNGFNAYWMMHVASDSDSDSGRSKVTQVFRQASAAGLTVCRTWAFSDGGDRALQILPGSYDERVFQGLDFVVCEAKKYGIRLILSLVNNYKDFGGKAQYVEWAKVLGGAQVNGDDDFYTDPTIKDYYKNHVRKVVTRLNTISGVAYREDPTIMAWELMNEPRCQPAHHSGSGTTLNMHLQRWIEEMARFVKCVDKKHLVEIGMEGFYGETMPQRKQSANPPPAGAYEYDQVGTDFIANNLVPEIDFATIHAYPDIWLPAKTTLQEQIGFMERWMRTHSQDSTNILNKPLVIAEFGIKSSSSNSNSNSNDRDLYLTKIYRDIYRSASASASASGISGISGSLVWQLMAQGMDDYNDGYQIILSQTPSTATIISNQSHAINALMSPHAPMQRSAPSSYLITS